MKETSLRSVKQLYMGKETLQTKKKASQNPHASLINNKSATRVIFAFQQVYLGTSHL